MKYVVTVVRYGSIEVDAPDGDEAVRIVNDTCQADSVTWDDDIGVLNADPMAETSD